MVLLILLGLVQGEEEPVVAVGVVLVDGEGRTRDGPAQTFWHGRARATQRGFRDHQVAAQVRGLASGVWGRCGHMASDPAVAF